MRGRRLAVDVAALAFLAVTALFFRLIAFPQAVIDWDESVYLLMARSMLQGHMPYTAVWDHKPPGVYVLFLLAQVLFGQSILSIRILAVLAVTASCFLLYLYGRNVLGSRRIGLLAGLFYAIFSPAEWRNGHPHRNSDDFLRSGGVLSNECSRQSPGGDLAGSSWCLLPYWFDAGRRHPDQDLGRF